MSGFLFDTVVFGPVWSRRLGISLGINLLPTTYKYCTFNCVYCECGWTKADDVKRLDFPSRETVRQALDIKLSGMKNSSSELDAITFAGNGEPTFHPEFADIINDTLELRNKYYPDVKVTVLSNSTMLHKEDVFNALAKIDNNILKLDAGTEKTFQLINKPKGNITLKSIIDNLKRFNGHVIIQSLFLTGKLNGEIFDNTTDEEIHEWLKHLKEIRPQQVMIYTFSRGTPTDELQKISANKLKEIAGQVEQLGIKSRVY